MRCTTCDYDDQNDSLYHNGTTETLQPRTFRVHGLDVTCSVCEEHSDQAHFEMVQRDFDKEQHEKVEVLDPQWDIIP